jgi:hypothetical protein
MKTRLETILETVQGIMEAGPAQARTKKQKKRRTVVDPKVEQQWSREGSYPAWMFGSAIADGNTTRAKMRRSDAMNSAFESEIEKHMRENPGISRERASSMASSSFTRGT